MMALITRTENPKKWVWGMRNIVRSFLEVLVFLWYIQVEKFTRQFNVWVRPVVWAGPVVQVGCLGGHQCVSHRGNRASECSHPRAKTRHTESKEQLAAFLFVLMVLRLEHIPPN